MAHPSQPWSPPGGYYQQASSSSQRGRSSTDTPPSWHYPIQELNFDTYPNSGSPVPPPYVGGAQQYWQPAPQPQLRHGRYWAPVREAVEVTEPAPRGGHPTLDGRFEELGQQWKNSGYRTDSRRRADDVTLEMPQSAGHTPASGASSSHGTQESASSPGVKYCRCYGT